MKPATEPATFDQLRLIEALRAALPQPAELRETHISWVLLAGDHAWKIKKAVNFGFLDFSTLEKRRFYCHEELRLNRRLAPQLYLDVVPIGGEASAPVLGGNAFPLPNPPPRSPSPEGRGGRSALLPLGEGPDGGGAGDEMSLRDARPIEYAVKMRRFAAADQLDAMLASGTLSGTHIDAVAGRIAAFHQSAAVAAGDSPFGTTEAVHQPTQQNFAQIRPRLADAADLERLRRLEAWSDAEFQRLNEFFARRKRDGYIRECHGDLHLANLALFEGEIVPFDCIEFNANLRWIDVISEIAFLAMDLHDRRRPDLAWRLLNAYLEQTGDYGGLAVLPYYLVYRALVRAKVAALACARDILEGDKLRLCRDYLALADTFIARPRPYLLITHGLSGSGKTTLTGELAPRLGAIRVRSDVERKRLFGLGATARSHSGVGSGLYTADAHRLTYRKLAELAQAIVAAGYPAIVDAAFLSRAEREAFRNLAEERDAGFAILDLQAPPDVLRQRIEHREKHGRDASEASVAVLQNQLSYDEALSENEQCRAIRVDTRHSSTEEIIAATGQVLARQG